MFKSYSNAALAAGLFFLGAVAAIISIVWVIGLNYCPESPCNYDYKHAHGPTDGPTQHQGWLPNPSLPNFTLQAEPDLKNEPVNRYEYADLVAQENMARATNVIALATIASVIISAFGLGALVYTFKVTREVSRDQARAYIDVDAVSFKWGGKKMASPKFMLVVRNSGLTPAKWYQIKSDYLIEAHEEDKTESFKDLEISSQFRGKWSGIVSGERGLTVKGPQIRDVSEFSKCLLERTSLRPDRAVPTHGIRVYGVVRYCTAFDEIYTSEFCFGANYLTAYESTDPVKTVMDDGPVTVIHEEWSEIPKQLSSWAMVEMDVFKPEGGQG